MRRILRGRIGPLEQFCCKAIRTGIEGIAALISAGPFLAYGVLRLEPTSAKLIDGTAIGKFCCEAIRTGIEGWLRPYRHPPISGPDCHIIEQTSNAMEEISRNTDAYGTTQKCTGPETSSLWKCLGPDSSAGSNQQPPILLMGDPIGDQG
uniref:ADP/ATP translocase n=1 Tax=Haemonchus contortus TaxID=6289 RepID=A0A7I4Y941_HAECO|nr:unnamed protein product [Haemonchus contortus]